VAATRAGSAALLALCLWPHAQTARAAEPEEPSLADLAKLVGEQQRALEEQKRVIEDLRNQLEETKKLSLSDHNRLEELSQAAPQPTVSQALEERLAKVEESVQEIPDIPAEVVGAGDFRGSLRIPGTDIQMRIAGLVRTTGVSTFGPLGTEPSFASPWCATRIVSERASASPGRSRTPRPTSRTPLA